jgi:hypothetical protein
MVDVVIVSYCYMLVMMVVMMGDDGWWWVMMVVVLLLVVLKWDGVKKKTEGLLFVISPAVIGHAN